VTRRPTRPQLRAIEPDATPGEVAAIVAAITAVQPRPQPTVAEQPARSLWVEATRLSARRSGLTRGGWRLSGRIGRRARA
jgi:hypothetical protein